MTLLENKEFCHRSQKKLKSQKLTLLACWKRQFNRSRVSWDVHGTKNTNLISLSDGRNLEKLDLDELDELEDSEDEAILLEFRNKRIAELKHHATRSKFGSVREITGEEYVNEVSHK